MIRSSWAQHQSLVQGRISVIIAPSHPNPLMQHQSLVQSRVNVSIPPPHPTPWHRHLVQGRGNMAEGTLTNPPPHVSVASTSCAWSREHGRGNVNIHTPLYSTPPHPILPHVTVGQMVGVASNITGCERGGLQLSHRSGSRNCVFPWQPWLVLACEN